MKIIGFNLAKTHYGLPLDNGGACLIVDGEVRMLINEERINRQQYSAGFAESFKYIFNATGLKLDDIDCFVASSCLETQRNPEQVKAQLLEYGFDVPVGKILVAGHHHSHAYSAYYPSGFNEAIVMVLDGDGNVLTQHDEQNKENYWLNRLEHNSYYVARGDTIALLERDNIGPGENGFGGAYRYFTYFCGFKGYKYAGKLMGLSAYGAQRNRFDDIKIFDCLPDGQIRCRIPDSDRLQSGRVVEEWLHRKGINIRERQPDEEITPDIEDAAYLIQRELDRALIHKVNYLVRKTGIKNLCIAGGVGLNAVTNRAILDNTPIENIYIQPAAGDSGQCLGNAYLGLHQKDAESIKRTSVSAYQGRLYDDEEIVTALEEKSEQVVYEKIVSDVLVKQVAAQIAQGKIVAWFQGKSEMGPRALGNRSILADPRGKRMKGVINLRVKHREYFRPFAPSVLLDRVKEWFDISVPAPYMIMNAQVKKPGKLQSVTHVDGSARLQTVSLEDNDRYYQLIEEFDRLTGVPVLLNTSFNDNEAIVESPRDALKTFLSTEIDLLIIGDFMIKKKNISDEWNVLAGKTSVIQDAKNKVLNNRLHLMLEKYGNRGQTKVFDYGCGWGEWMYDLTKKGYAVSGFDASKEMVNQVRKNFPDLDCMTQEEFCRYTKQLNGSFDIVTSNLVLCILDRKQQEEMLGDIKSLVKEDGLILLSFCHPCFDYDKEGLVSVRHTSPGHNYEDEFVYTKTIKENDLCFGDFHRSLAYYSQVFNDHGLQIMEIAESDTLGTSLKPDFIIFALKKRK